eukprot:SAG31_NODE_5417_length_2549_cov_2.290612_6_plen_57_part_00
MLESLKQKFPTCFAGPSTVLIQLVEMDAARPDEGAWDCLPPTLEPQGRVDPIKLHR